MYDAGCRWLMFGIESGCREILKCVKKGINYKNIEQTCSDCADTGIVVRAGFIIGFPGETENNLKETAALAMRLKTSQVSINYYTIVPDSEAYEQLLRDGTIRLPQNLQAFVEKHSFDKLNNICSNRLKNNLFYFIMKRYTQKNGFFRNSKLMDKNYRRFTARTLQVATFTELRLFKPLCQHIVPLLLFSR